MNVEYHQFGSIVVEERKFDHDVVIDRGSVRARDKGPSRDRKHEFGHTPLTAAEDIPWSGDRLFIGTGYSGRLPLEDGVWTAARDRGVELVVVPTADACAILRDLEPAEVNAILHVTC